MSQPLLRDDLAVRPDSFARDPYPSSLDGFCPSGEQTCARAGKRVVLKRVDPLSAAGSRAEWVGAKRQRQASQRQLHGLRLDRASLPARKACGAQRWQQFAFAIMGFESAMRVAANHVACLRGLLRVGPRATQAQSPKPRRELGCSRGLFRQRGVRIAEKLGQAPSDGCVVSSGVFLAERGGQYSEQVVCPRRSAVAQKQPGSLEVVNMRDALQEPVLGSTFDAELALHKGIGSERRAQHDETLLILGQRPIPNPYRITALGLEVPDALRFLASGIPGFGFGAVEADARMLPQGDLDVVLIQLEDPPRCSNDVDVVQEGKKQLCHPGAVIGQLAEHRARPGRTAHLCKAARLRTLLAPPWSSSQD